MCLVTLHLMIAACPLDAAQSLIEDRSAAKEILGAWLPADWPSPELAEMLPLYVQELLHTPSALGWGIWIVIHRGENVVIGDVGFKGLPDADGTVEIGYEVVPAYRGRGHATEAVRALIPWAFGHPEVRRIVAECAPENAASIRILTKVGFQPIPAAAEALRWELPAWSRMLR